MHAAVVAAVPAVVVAWWNPRSGLVAGLAVVGLAGLAGAMAAWRHRRTSAARLFAATPAADGLTRLRDGLATWVEQDRAIAGEAAAATTDSRVSSNAVMADWLADELDHAIADLPAASVSAVGRRRLGRWRWLVPLLLALLIAWLVLLFWQPPWPGLLGGRPDRPDGAGGAVAAGTGTGGGGVGAGGGSSTAGDSEPSQSLPESPDGPGSEPPLEDPQPEDPQPEEPPPSEPPAPFLDLPKQKLFEIPKFIGDGPTTRVRAHVAEVPVGGRPEPSADQRAGRSGGERPIVAPPPPQAVDFERAAERARAARHVPPAERPIVRRFFELLREAAK